MAPAPLHLILNTYEVFVHCFVCGIGQWLRILASIEQRSGFVTQPYHRSRCKSHKARHQDGR